MPRPFLLMLVAFTFVACAASRGQPPTGPMPPGEISVANVTGPVSLVVNGVAAELREGGHVTPSAKIITGHGGSVDLHFSNGTIVQLGAETEVVVRVFLQDPVPTQNRARALDEEPSVAHTTLALNRGELDGKVKKLHVHLGSSFASESPVGVADSVGGTFRMGFRPNGSGTASFQLKAVEHEIGFAAPGGGGNATAGKRRVVPPGEEIAVTVNVTAGPL